MITIIPRNIYESKWAALRIAITDEIIWIEDYSLLPMTGAVDSTRHLIFSTSEVHVQDWAPPPGGKFRALVYNETLRLVLVEVLDAEGNLAGYLEANPEDLTLTKPGVI